MTIVQMVVVQVDTKNIDLPELQIQLPHELATVLYSPRNHGQPSVTASVRLGALPPGYLSVEGWANCLTHTDAIDGSSSQWCLPATQPTGCTGNSWTLLAAPTVNLPACASNEDLAQRMAVTTRPAKFDKVQCHSSLSQRLEQRI